MPVRQGKEIKDEKVFSFFMCSDIGVWDYRL
jgi:hypothetical protein